jgi:hypothetical protein
MREPTARIEVSERAEHHVAGHELGERGRREALVGLFRGEDLAAGEVGEEPGPGGDQRRLLRVRAGARQCKGQR